MALCNIGGLRFPTAALAATPRSRYTRAVPAISIARVLAVALGLSACRDHASGDKTHTSEASPTAANAQTAQRPSGTIDIVELPDGQPLLAWIANEVARATKDSKTAIVYVGATWCEPCETFARAVRAGKLDREFPTLRLLHVDLDAHQDELNGTWS